MKLLFKLLFIIVFISFILFIFTLLLINTIKMKNLTSQEVSTLNALRDSLDETMIKAGYSVAYLTRCKTILRKIIEKNEGNIQQ